MSETEKNDLSLAEKMHLDSERSALASGRKRRVVEPGSDELRDRAAAARAVEPWYAHCLMAVATAASEGSFSAQVGYSEGWGTRKAARACVKKLEAERFTAYWDIRSIMDDCGGDEVVVFIEW